MDKVYLCPTDKRHKCPWEGDIDDIYDHFIDCHEDLLRHTNELEVSLAVRSENILIFHEEEIYLVQHRLHDDVLHIKLRFLGLHELASKITYDIALKDNPERVQDQLSVISRNGGWEINLKQAKFDDVDLACLYCTLIINKIGLKEDIADEKCDIGDSATTVEEKSKTTKLKKNNSYTLGSKNDQRKVLSRSLRHKSVIIVRKHDTTDSLSLSSSDLQKNEDIEETDMAIDEACTENYTEKDLMCSTCEEIMLPPIYICETGHSICSVCKQHSCKICNLDIMNNRNKELENISRNFLYSCKYGCEQKFRYNELLNHQIGCIFCTYSCPIPDCPVTGTMSIFHEHILIFHKDKRIQVSLQSEFPKGSDFFIVNTDKGIFYCICEEKIGTLEWQVVFCGPSERQFFCEIYFKNSKNKDRIYFKRNKEKYLVRKSEYELKKMKVKDKHAVLEITSYD